MASRRLIAAGALLWAVAISAQAPTLDDVLGRSGEYVADFIDRFSNVVAEERYVQDAIGNLPSVTLGRGGGNARRSTGRHRELKSDFLLVKIGQLDWLPFRDVFEVDGQPVRDREDRLAKLFLMPWADALAQATQIATESARYNLGDVQRTINTPILPLIFLYRDVRPRFHFTLVKRDGATWIVDYKEEGRPTAVRGRGDTDVPASGRFWIDGETGRVSKIQLDLAATGVRARLTTSFRRDDRFQIDVPFSMAEEYFLDRGTVTGTATYANFRRFQVRSDEQFEKPPAADSAPR